MYKLIGYAAIFFTPLAPSTFFGWRVYSVVNEMTNGLWWLAICAAIASVVGLESVGVIAGHTTLDAFRLGKYEAAGFAAVVVIAYVSIGFYELRGTIGAIIFLIAPLAYLAVGLRESLQEIDKQAKRETAQKYNFRQAQLDAQLRLQMEKERLKQEASIEKAKLKTIAPVATPLHNATAVQDGAMSKQDMCKAVYQDGMSLPQVCKAVASRYNVNVSTSTASRALAP